MRYTEQNPARQYSARMLTPVGGGGAKRNRGPNQLWNFFLPEARRTTSLPTHKKAFLRCLRATGGVHWCKWAWGVIRKYVHMGSSMQIAFSRVWYDIFSRRVQMAWVLFFFPSLMHSICPRDLHPATPAGIPGIFFGLMYSICPKDLNSAPCNPYWYTRFFFSLLHSICPRDQGLGVPCAVAKSPAIFHLLRTCDDAALFVLFKLVSG